MTQLLKHSLGGNSFTVMVACLCEGDSHIEENLSTLAYASQAASITNIPIVNEDPKNRIIRSLEQEVASLRERLLIAQNLAMQAIQAAQSGPCGRCGMPTLDNLEAQIQSLSTGPSSQLSNQTERLGKVAAGSALRSVAILKSADAMSRAQSQSKYLNESITAGVIFPPFFLIKRRMCFNFNIFQIFYLKKKLEKIEKGFNFFVKKSFS